MAVNPCTPLIGDDAHQRKFSQQLKGSNLNVNHQLHGLPAVFLKRESVEMEL